MDDSYGDEPQESKWKNRLSAFFIWIKYIWEKIEPTVINLINMIIYDTIQLIKSVLSTVKEQIRF